MPWFNCRTCCERRRRRRKLPFRPYLEYCGTRTVCSEGSGAQLALGSIWPRKACAWRSHTLCTLDSGRQRGWGGGLLEAPGGAEFSVCSQARWSLQHRGEAGWGWDSRDWPGHRSPGRQAGGRLRGVLLPLLLPACFPFHPLGQPPPPSGSEPGKREQQQASRPLLPARPGRGRRGTCGPCLRSG